ncbi:MAG: phospholipid carrier-dependent glycosyltransferase [Bacillati bacterium ANGP1]|uniref:Phospholipid carrier-dependent glycosyltransferase n=1 Tax=Candidatus Segetimicrobium genomatis TaxID=2569760 RepID=A0A537JMY2_9BACT|nr:MAG: phospholipid carrier-dependent glycosyltransferase [Terrabacteria group bacterium ANGP1]
MVRGWAEIGERSFRILLIVVLAIAAETRFLGLADRSLWFDEAYSVSVTHGSFLQLVWSVRLFDTHPPLYYALLKGWTLLFGSGEIAVRSLSAVFGVLMVPLLYGFARRMADREVALAAAALLAGSASGCIRFSGCWPLDPGPRCGSPSRPIEGRSKRGVEQR